MQNNVDAVRQSADCQSQLLSEFLFLRQTPPSVIGRPPPVSPLVQLFQYLGVLWGLRVQLSLDRPARKKIKMKTNQTKAAGRR